jgi:phosphohistidine phosphatase
VLTSKTLLLVRHAKSSWKNIDLDDIDRPLNQRGFRDAPDMGQRLSGRLLIPGLIVSSPAVRALATARAIGEEIGYTDDIVVEDNLYGAAPQEVLDITSEFDDRLRVAMIVLHNPTITELANMFSIESIENVPTCGVLVIEATAWSHLETARLMDFDYPKNLT